MIQKTAMAMLLTAAWTLPAAAAAPLPPGRAAGAKNAELTEQQTIFVGVGVLVVGVGVYLASGEYKIAGDDSAAPPVTPPATAPSTTTTQ
jgi:hypothetical protein